MTAGGPSLPPAARDLYEPLRALPIVSPHGHCDPAWWAEDRAFADPASLMVKPDHYLFRMLYSQGVPLADLGILPSGETRMSAPDSRDVFRVLARHWDAFLGTPTRLWIEHTFHEVIGVSLPFSDETSDRVHDEIADWLAAPENRPRALFDRFGIEVLATTDAALSDLSEHAAIRASGWGGRIIPTFRPDNLIDPARPGFAGAVQELGAMTGHDTTGYGGYLDAIRERRAAFKAAGATATDHDVPYLMTHDLGPKEAKALFEKSFKRTATEQDTALFHGHMLTRMAEMSVDDGLVMQIHAGATRSTNADLARRYGPDMGADIPRAINWVDGLDALLNRVGANPRFRLVVFTLDEATYARELAPMAGHWPALRIGPPWWFHDSLNGIRRYFDQVVETAGYFNLAGFNDDTRAFLSIPARHDLWRRGVALHLSDQVDRGVMGRADAERLAPRLAVGLARETYRLGPGGA